MSSGLTTKRDFQIAKTPAWHKLTIIEEPTREKFPEIVKEALSFRGEPLLYTRGESDPQPYFVYVSQDDNKPVGIPFKDSYNTLLPRQAWDWLHDVLGGTKFHVESMGMIWNRSQWFVTVSLDELKDLSIGGRESRFLLNASGGLDKSYSPQMELSNTVIVCANTLAVSRMTGEVLFKTKATKNFQNKLEESKQEIEKAVGMSAIFKKTMDSLATKPCTIERAERIFAGFVTPETDTEMSTRTRNTVKVLTDLHKTGIGNRGETEFDLLNSFTQYGTRGNETKHKDNPEQMWKAFARGEFGLMADRKAEFAKLLTGPRPNLHNVEKRGKALTLIAETN